MIALPIFSSSSGEGEGLWCVAENGAGCAVEEAHITALGHSQATTLPLSVATFAHCHNVWIGFMMNENKKCNYSK